MAQEIADSKLLDTWGSSGTKIEPDISKIIEGWQLGEQPPHEYMNWLQNTFGSKLNHILKNGIAEWNNETEYLAGSSVQHSGNVWLCKTTNTNSEPTELNANWGKVAINKDLTVNVDTLADLRNINYPANTVWASGYHAKNDGAFGSHIFRLKGVKTTETDNGGTVIIATIGGVDYVYELQFDGAVNVKWFGAVGDCRNKDRSLNASPTDDTQAIQDAIMYAVKNNIHKITADSGSTFKTSSTIYIPTPYRAPTSIVNKEKVESIFILDWNGAEFIGDGYNEVSNFACFESAYFDSNGDLQTTIGTSNEYYLSAGVNIRNVCLTDYYIGVKIQGFVYGSSISDVFCVNVSQAIWATRSFYCEFKRVICRGNYSIGVPRFWFGDQNNIMPITQCTTGDCDIGFYFDGIVEALVLNNCGIEGHRTTGVVLNSGIANVKFDSCYFESSYGVGIKTNSYINSLDIDNCWIFGGTTLLGDLASGSNIKLRDNNRFGGGSLSGIENIPNQSSSIIDYGTLQREGGNNIPVIAASPSTTIMGNTVVHSSSLGYLKILGVAKNTSKFHSQKVNGQFSVGFSSDDRNGVGYTYEFTPEVSLKRKIRFVTSISWSDTQNIYVALRSAHNNGTWTLFANIYGSNIIKHYESATNTSGAFTISNVGGYVVLESPEMPVISGGILYPLSGEIRLI